MREHLDAHPDLRHDTRACRRRRSCAWSARRKGVAEGAFFPDTYLFAKRSSDVELLARAYRAMQRHLAGRVAGEGGNAALS
jgi:UPF0755 protein